ncbi:MAG: TusE/DsrC/DsvC family sulfur relay protein [Gammaproteobacteria bacterium]
MSIAHQNVSTAAVREPLFDEDGFVADPASWTPELARRIAELDGIGPLNGRHWRVIDYLRERVARLGGIPAMRSVCKATDTPKAEIHALFGSCLTVWRVAGLPNPGEEAKAYLP